jgi:hypothetical protein
VRDPFGWIHAWLWRDIEIPDSWPTDGEVAVSFGAVMYRCDVWLDSILLGEHEGGYTPFSLVIDDGAGRRRLAVRVTNPLNAITEYPALSAERLDAAEAAYPALPIREIPHGKQTWYGSQSGIWRSVALELRPRTRVGRLRAAADWRRETAALSASVDGADGAAVRFSVRDPEGTVVADGAATVVDGGAVSVLSVPDRLAWSPAIPNLYVAAAQLVADGRIVDERTARFGFREISTAEGRVVLNGRPILLRGALDQDIYPRTISAPPSRAMIEEEFRLARAAGLNLVRCHIKVPDPAYLDVADETGTLLWCELPSWLRLTADSAARAERTLEELVELVADHPSVVIWTIVNEDWGTDLRYSEADRAWLHRMATRLRQLDPTRLVVDNSACATPDGPNFHVDTDIADFHRYAAMPDAAERWRAQMAELAGRPPWLWSDHGDAVRRGGEPVVLSEFGTWALPDPAVLDGAWWSSTGDPPARPASVERRFWEQRLDRVWPDLGSLARATQEAQVEALRYQVGEARRHPGMAGLVVTELTDANWEANGLLDLERRPKAGNERLAEIFGPRTLIIDVARRDLWAGEPITISATVSSEEPGNGGILHLRLGGARASRVVPPWGAATATPLGDVELAVPDHDETTDVEVEAWLEDQAGLGKAASRLRCGVLPRQAARSLRPRRVAVAEGPEGSALAERLRSLGHDVSDERDVDLMVTSRLDDRTLAAAEAGRSVLVLARSPDAIPAPERLARHIGISARWPAPGSGHPSAWSGDWISAWSWILPTLSRLLPWRAPLDFAYAEVLPDHVVTGYDPSRHAGEVSAGIFVGWVDHPAALIWRFGHARGVVTVTTFRVAPESGPVATALLEALVQHAASGTASDEALISEGRAP